MEEHMHIKKILSLTLTVIMGFAAVFGMSGVTAFASNEKMPANESALSPFEKDMYDRCVSYLTDILKQNGKGVITPKFTYDVPDDCVVTGDDDKLIDTVNDASDRVYYLLEKKHTVLTMWSDFMAVDSADDDYSSLKKIKIRFYANPFCEADHDSSARKLKFSRLQKMKKVYRNIKSVLKKYKGLSDYKKIRAYAQWIADHTSYDYEGYYHGDLTDSATSFYGVFDGNPKTKSVCSGYADAFQLLMDNSFFYDKSIRSILVESTDHAWNVVTIGGKNYFVDVTWGDEERAGYLNGLYFLNSKKVLDNLNKGKCDRLPKDNNNHVYNHETRAAYTRKELTISKKKYNPASDKSVKANRKGISDRIPSDFNLI